MLYPDAGSLQYHKADVYKRQGHVGSRIQRMAEALGMRVLLNDPPRADRGETEFVDLSVLARECDNFYFVHSL